MRVPPVRVGTAAASPETKDRFDADLHDVANALAAARAYGDVVYMRTKANTVVDPAIVESLVRELERANEILRNVRRETYQKGDVLRCTQCAYSWVHRQGPGKRPSCRRCSSLDVERWKPE